GSAEATRGWFRAFAGHSFLAPLSMTPGSSIIASPELRCRHRLRRDLSSSALPILPQSVSRGARLSGLPDSRICYGLPSCSLPCTDQTDCSALGSVYFQASNGSVALPVAGYDYNSDWTPLLAGLSPARMAASLAAPDPYVQLSRIRFPPWVSTAAICCRMRASIFDTLMRR